MIFGLGLGEALYTARRGLHYEAEAVSNHAMAMAELFSRFLSTPIDTNYTPKWFFHSTVPPYVGSIATFFSLTTQDEHYKTGRIYENVTARVFTLFVYFTRFL